MDGINVLSLLQLAYKKLWALILVFAVFASAAYAYCLIFASPRYRATASIIVTNGAIISGESSNNRGTISGTDVSASISLSETVMDILKTSEIYKQTAKEIGNKYSHRALMGMVSIARHSEESMLIDISFTASNREDAILLSNIFSSRSCEYVQKFIPDSKVSVTQEAEGASKIEPNKIYTAGLYGLAGAALLYIVFVILQVTNKIIQSGEEVSEKYDIPILGQIPDFDTAESAYAKRKYKYSRYYSKRYYGRYEYAKSQEKKAAKSNDKGGKE